jgi:hypothetical protein
VSVLRRRATLSAIHRRSRRIQASYGGWLLRVRSMIHLALDNAAPIIDSPISYLWEYRLRFGVTCSASRQPIP